MTIENAYILKPQGCGSVTKATTRLLGYWRTFLSQEPTEKEKIEGERDSGGESVCRDEELDPEKGISG